MEIQQPPTEKDIHGILTALEDLLFDKTPPAPANPPSPEREAHAPLSLQEPEMDPSGLGKATSLFELASHDLRSPLSAIILYIEYLLKGEGGNLNEEQARILKIITEHTKRLANFLGNLIDLHKVTQGGLQLPRSPQQMSEIVGEIANLHQVVAEKSSIALSFQAPENLPLVWGNGPKIEQVVINLLSNAFKFTPREGHITIRLDAIADQEVYCAIQDTGLGIPDEKFNQLFKNYSQLDLEMQNRVVRGMGLGLLISKEIIDALGGKIWAESWPGRGSTFYFSLPQVNAPTS